MPNTDSSSGASRRDFLKKSALAAAALASGPALFKSSASAAPGAAKAVSAASASSVSGANNRIRVGFVGVGGQGFGTHVRTVASNAAAWNIEGVAVCDVWKKRIERAANHLGIGEADGYEDHRKLLERKDIDAIYIGAVDHWHAQIAIDALDAGKHVFCEKPMTRHLAEAFKVHDAVKRSGKIFQLGTHYCSEGHWHRAGELVRNGQIGPLVLAQTSFARNKPTGEWNYAIDPEATADSVDWKRWLGPVSDRPFDADAYFRWRKYYPYCSGILGDLLSHKLHPLMIATATMDFPTRVACLGTRRITTDRDVPDTTQFMVEFPTGLNVHIMGSTVNEVGVPEVIRGHHATLYLGGKRIEIRPERPFADEIDREEFTDITDESHHKNFFDAIRGESAPNAGIDLAIRGQTVISMAEMSERLGEMVYFDPEKRQTTDSRGNPIDPIDYGNLT